MSAPSRRFLFGPYVTPVISRGAVVVCEIRGLVKIVGMSDSPIPWPVGERDGERALIVYKGLARAVRFESPEAVAAAWGVNLETVHHWQTVVPLPEKPPRRLRFSQRPIAESAIKPDEQAWTAYEDEVIRTVAPQVAAEKLRRSRGAVDARRRELGLPEPEPHGCPRGTRPWKRWQAWEDALLATVSLAEAAERTGRTWLAVAQRRHRLGLTSPPGVATKKTLQAKRTAAEQAVSAAMALAYQRQTSQRQPVEG